MSVGKFVITRDYGLKIFQVLADKPKTFTVKGVGKPRGYGSRVHKIAVLVMVNSLEEAERRCANYQAAQDELRPKIVEIEKEISRRQEVALAGEVKP